MNKDGTAKFINSEEREAPVINSLRCWEQAFEIFAMILHLKVSSDGT